MISLLSIFLLPILGSLNSANFPEVLSPEEENKYLKLWQEKNMEARNVLIEHNLRLVAHIVKKFENTHVEKDDLLSIGTFGLIKAVDTYNFSSHVRLATYASRCIENEILMQLRKKRKVKNDISLDKPLCEDGDGNELVLADILPSDDDVEQKTVDIPSDRQMINKLVEHLSSREREIMVLRYGLMGHEELTQREVALKLGISQSYISRLEKRILKDMKQKLQASL